MFCEKCGAKLPEDAVFCTNCGVNLERKSVNTEKISDTKVLLEVHPTFNFIYMTLPLLIFFTVLLLIIVIPISTISIAASLIAFLIGALIIAVLVGIKTYFNKKQYANYSYNFYRTKVIFRDSFLNLSEKEVKYRYIREVTKRQTFIQRYFNLGSIILYTNAESGYGNGISIFNIENVDEIYRKIKSIIDV